VGTSTAFKLEANQSIVVRIDQVNQ
jgi:hypothetical protein